MYQCNYRISDKFEEDVISVALLTDENLEFREHIHEISFCGFRLYFEFPMVKLLKYQENWDALERDPNPFAIATMAFLKTVETKGHEYERYQWKKYFLLELYRRGMSRETILALYDFIGVIMALPLAKDEQLYEEIKPTMEEKQMSVLAVAERVGLQKGIAQGISQGLRRTISDIMEIRFGVAGLELLDPIERIGDIEVLEKIRTGLKRVQSISEAEALIREHATKHDQSA